MRFLRQKMNLNDIPLADYVVFSIKMVLLYTAIILILAIIGIDVTMLDNLTTCYYGCFGGEVLTCGLIKVFKLHKEIKTTKGGDMML